MTAGSTVRSSGVPEVYAIRYATMRGRRASEVFYRYDLYGLDDRIMDMECYFWLVRDGTSVTLVDCGWDRETGLSIGGGRYRHIEVDETDPVELLGRLGVAPGDVQNVIVTHMHFDHMGNLGLFPNATVILARAEYECWTGPYGSYAALTHSTPSKDVHAMQDRERRGLLRLVDGTEEVLPNVFVTPVGGHTPGQMIVDVVSGDRRVVLASDALHYHEEVEHGRPFYIYTDMARVVEVYDILRAKADAPNTWVVSGHDPLEMSRFALVNRDCADLTRPLA